MDKQTWCEAYTKALIAAATATENPRKLEAAHDHAARLAAEYYEDVDIWPDPEEAAAFEVTCWHWMPNERRH